MTMVTPPRQSHGSHSGPAAQPSASHADARPIGPLPLPLRQVDMNRPCKFWRHETAGCGTSHCSVVPCEDEDVPPAVRTLEEVRAPGLCSCPLPLGRVQRSCPPPVPAQLPFECTPREVSPLGELRDTVTSQQLEDLASWQQFDQNQGGFCDTECTLRCCRAVCCGAEPRPSASPFSLALL